MKPSKRTQVNRENAKASTGPRTVKGKAAAARNALKHGLLSGVPLIPGEDPVALETLERELFADLAPQGAVETELAQRAALYFWRLRRTARVEAGVFAAARYRETGGAARSEAAQFEEREELFNLQFGGPVRITDEAAHAEAVDRAREANRMEHADDLLPYRVFLADAAGANGMPHGTEVLDKIARYETGMERNAFRALHELERRQANRHAQAAPLAPDK